MSKDTKSKKSPQARPSGFALGGDSASSANEMRQRRLAALEGGGAEETASIAANSDTITTAEGAAATKEDMTDVPTTVGGSTAAVAAPRKKTPTYLQKPPLPPNGKPLTDEWRTWLRLNAVRGCNQQVLFNRCVVEQGFRIKDVLEALQEKSGVGGEKKETKEIWPEDLKSTDKKTTTITITKSVPLSNGWKEWIRVRMDQGSDKEEIFLHCLHEGLDLDQVAQALGGYRARPIEMEAPPKWPFMKRSFVPRAWKSDTELAQVYEIPHFLTPTECQQVIQRIDNGILQRSIVTRAGQSDSRTSRTCHLRIEQGNKNEWNTEDIVYRVEQKLQALMGKDAAKCAETLQGQRYGVGEYFQAHTDWFTPNTEEYKEHCRQGGQRTWTVMVYLNAVEQGGGTKFEHLDREFVPTQGMALAWNNQDADGSPNPWTLHEAMPVLKGTKYVLTKWFREQSMVD